MNGHLVSLLWSTAGRFGTASFPDLNLGMRLITNHKLCFYFRLKINASKSNQIIKKGKEEDCSTSSFCEIFQMHHFDSNWRFAVHVHSAHVLYLEIELPINVLCLLTKAIYGRWPYYRKVYFSTGGRFCCHHSITGSSTLDASITSYPGSLGMKGAEA